MEHGLAVAVFAADADGFLPLRVSGAGISWLAGVAAQPKGQDNSIVVVVALDHSMTTARVLLQHIGLDLLLFLGRTWNEGRS